MNFTELKRWAKSHGYEVLKSKGTEECLWTKIDDASVTGIAPSLSETAKDIYNHITNYVWVEYQQEYQKEKNQTDIKW